MAYLQYWKLLVLEDGNLVRHLYDASNHSWQTRADNGARCRYISNVSEELNTLVRERNTHDLASTAIVVLDPKGTQLSMPKSSKSGVPSWAVAESLQPNDLPPDAGIEYSTNILRD